MDRPAKVSNLEVPPQPQQQVFRLDVTVDDLLGVTVHEDISQLEYVLYTPHTCSILTNMISDSFVVT